MSEISGVGGAKTSVIGVTQGRMPVFDEDLVEVDFAVIQELNSTILGPSMIDSLRWRVRNQVICVTTSDGRILPLAGARGHLYLRWDSVEEQREANQSQIIPPYLLAHLLRLLGLLCARVSRELVSQCQVNVCSASPTHPRFSLSHIC